jgi:hypothetical protein
MHGNSLLICTHIVGTTLHTVVVVVIMISRVETSGSGGV